jgi:hypothetical protein
MQQKFILFFIFIISAISFSCSNSPSTAKVGDIFAFDNKDKTFHVVRVLEIDDKRRYINLYGNAFNELPKTVKLEDLYISLPCRQTEPDCREGFRQVKGELNIVPFELSDALDENWKYVGNIPVTEDEKQKFAAWKKNLRGLDNR